MTQCACRTFAVSAVTLLLVAGVAVPSRAQTSNPWPGLGVPLTRESAPEAREKLRTALEAYRQQGDRQGEAVCWLLLGSVASEWVEARAHLEQSAALFEAQGDRFGAWMAYEILAEAAAGQGEVDAAMGSIQRALAVLREAAASAATFSPTSLQRMNQARGGTADNMELVLSAPELVKPILLRYSMVVSRMTYGGILLDACRLEEAESELAKAADDARLFEGMFAASLAVRFGDLHRQQWRLDEARESYRKALEGAAPQPVGGYLDQSLDEIQILEKLIDIEMLSGRVDEALAWNDRLLLRARRRGNGTMEASALHVRGKILMESWRYGTAEVVLVEALEMAQKRDHALLEGSILFELGNLELLVGRFEKAAAHLQTAARLFQTEGVHAAEAASWTQASGAYLYLEAYDTAGLTLEKALTAARESGDRRAQESAELMAALLRFRLHPNDSSEIERLIGALEKSPEVLWDDVVLCFRALASLVGGGPPPSLPPASSSQDLERYNPEHHNFVHGLLHFQHGDTAKARELWARALMESPVQERKAELFVVLGHTFWKEGKLDKAITYLSRAVDALEKNAGDIAVEELLTTYLAGYNQSLYRDLIGLLISQGRLEEAFDYTERARARAFLQSLGNRRRAPANRADARLAEKAAVLRARIVQWERERWTSPPREQARLSSDLRHARERYESLLVSLKMTNPEYASANRVEPLRLQAVRDELPPDATLISYFVAADRVDAWVLDRETFRHFTLFVGPEALQRAVCWADEIGRLEGDRGVQVQDRRCAAGSARSEEVYDQLIAPLLDRLRNPRLVLVPHGLLHYLPFAALRNPKTGRYLLEDYTITYAPSASALRFLRAMETPVEGWSLVLGDPAASTPNLAPLPAARREAAAVARALGTSPLVGPQAAESRLLGLGGQVDLLHIAAHGFFEPEAPLFSRVALAPGQDRDGNLEVHEILGELDLSGVNLVVLSACRTAAGERSGGDEIVGLTRAFLYAGSPGVLSTLWAIDDEASAVLMEELYRRLLSGASVADALRQAQLSLLHGTRYADPYFWAPFTLSGNPQGRWRAQTVQEE